MTQKHILSLLVSAALLCGLLAGCSNTNGDASHASSSASEPSSVSSESTPSSTAQADTSGLFNKDFDENSLFSVDGTAAAFEPSLGWGPGVSGCSLKSVQPPCWSGPTRQTSLPARKQPLRTPTPSGTTTSPTRSRRASPRHGP